MSTGAITMSQQEVGRLQVIQRTVETRGRQAAAPASGAPAPSPLALYRDIGVKGDHKGVEAVNASRLADCPRRCLRTSRTSSRALQTIPRFGRSAHAPSQGLKISIPISSKSRTLRVATAMPCERAIAAIWQSAGETTRPANRRLAAICA